MGYTTEFTGTVSVTPPLNPDEISYLRSFCETRRMRRAKGPYYVGGGGFWGQASEDDIDDYNEPPPGQPGLWCQWIPINDDGTDIGWDGGEKFYNAEEWMRYLIEHFLAEPAHARGSEQDERFARFTFDHVLNGVVEAQGEDPADLWRLIVRDNAVSRVDAMVTFPEPVEPSVVVAAERLTTT